MTMLDRMRRHKNWLKWSLLVVCLSFVFFYIPSFLRSDGAGASPGDTVAEVEGYEITVGEFNRRYRNKIQAYQAAYGGQINEQMLKQLGIDQQILQEMIDERAGLAEARRLGLRVTDAEIRERIVSMPEFQEGGAFIGEVRYRQLLRFQRPPLTPDEFENTVRLGIQLEKLRGAVSDWVTVSKAEVEDAFRRRNEKVKLEVVYFPSGTFTAEAQVSDAELTAHFGDHKTEYRIPEKRKIKYLLVDVQALKSRVQIPVMEVERYYNDHAEQYSTPEQVRASHILLKTEGKNEADVKNRAEAILARARAGEDFAELAKKNSEDEASAKNGGDLDYFGTGRMVPEFEAAAFSLQPGAMSDLVKTQYGFHIIKVVDKKPASAKTLSEVRSQIEDQLKWERAQAQATDLARTIADDVSTPADLDRVAKERGLRVQESPFFARNEPIPTLGFTGEVSSQAFDLKAGEVSDAIGTPQGQVLLTVSGKKDAYSPQLDEVREKVRADVAKKKAIEIAKKKAAEALPSLRPPATFVEAAKKAGLEVKSTDLIARNTAIPDVGVSAAVDALAFTLAPGSVSDPIVTDGGVAIIHVLERKDVSVAELAEGSDRLRTELLQEKRERFFSAYMIKAKQRMKIEIDRDTLQQVI
ncbi:MAG: SurA N-terminal domain-containing protein [Acidobacteria bacterium]|nr:SurA N-terminal domain-containing protein [Acidobacteriota bacterium]